MIPLALRSLRHRATSFTATFVAVALGSALIGAFATLFEASFRSVSSDDAETLRIMGAVIGGWGTVIVLFSVASTLSITTRQRAEEIGLLRVIGATPSQARRLVRVEALIVTTTAAVVGAISAWPIGSALLSFLRRSDLVGREVAFGTPFVSVGAAAFLVASTSVLAATITARRSIRGSASMAFADRGHATATVCAGGAC